MAKKPGLKNLFDKIAALKKEGEEELEQKEEVVEPEPDPKESSDEGAEEKAQKPEEGDPFVEKLDAILSEMTQQEAALAKLEEELGMSEEPELERTQPDNTPVKAESETTEEGDKGSEKDDDEKEEKEARLTLIRQIVSGNMSHPGVEKIATLVTYSTLQELVS